MRLCLARSLLRQSTFLAILLPILFVQLYFAAIRHVDVVAHLSFSDGGLVSSVLANATPLPSTVDHRTDSNRHSFGACLMVKNDNDLLYEWIAYHYTVLPLGMLVVGSDLDNQQDPNDVLNRWTQSGIHDFEYWILNANDFIHRHGNYTESYGVSTRRGNLTSDQVKNLEHHALIHRQKGFLTVCTEVLKRKGARWVVYIDSDEFVVFNPITPEDDVSAMSNESLSIRNTLANDAHEKTVLDFVLDWQHDNTIHECYTMPRLLVGALENRTCPGTQSIQQLAQAQLRDRYSHMSTLRFNQHAQKGDFARSKYGKVMMDLSRIPDRITRQQPRNIHRPYADYCGSAGGARFPDSFLFVMHYIGSWERYKARGGDLRRNRNEWEQRAFVDFVAPTSKGSSACASKIYAWYSRFLIRLGSDEGHASYILGA